MIKKLIKKIFFCELYIYFLLYFDIFQNTCCNVTINKDTNDLLERVTSVAVFFSVLSASLSDIYALRVGDISARAIMEGALHGTVSFTRGFTQHGSFTRAFTRWDFHGTISCNCSDGSRMTRLPSDLNA